MTREMSEPHRAERMLCIWCMGSGWRWGRLGTDVIERYHWCGACGGSGIYVEGPSRPLHFITSANAMGTRDV